MIETLKGFIEEANKKIVVLKDTKLEEKTYQCFLKTHLEEMKNMRVRVEDIHNCMRSTDNYLEKYQPYNAFCQLFEILRMALEPS